jgi:hypothetical protein
MTHHALRTALLLAASLLAIAGCGGSVVNPGGSGGSGGSGGQGGSGGSSKGTCKVDPAGSTFVFHVKNTPRSLSYGCGSVPSMVLSTPGGMQTITPFDLSFCGFTCEAVYANPGQNWGCSDCGPGYGADLPAGATVDVQWDRRAYEQQTADPQCAGEMDISCALGIAVAPATMQAGVLTVCSQDAPSNAGGPGYCTGPTIPVSFTVDTTQSEGTIEVQ